MNTNPISANFSKLVLPKRFEEVTNTIQAITHAPTELIAGIQLAVMSHACQGVVEFEHSDGRRSPVSLYSIILAESGRGKRQCSICCRNQYKTFRKKS